MGEMRISLVATVKDDAEHIEAFLASLAAQKLPPDEVIVVDGGSTDGTLDALRKAEGIRLHVEPGANIARGRNIAIASASHDVIAVTDADCELEPDWLERLVEPLRAGADVAMGVSRPIVESFLQGCMAAASLPDPEEIGEATFMPSSRSVAFRRSAIEAAGGYPEWLDIGEDMYVNHRWRELGVDMRLASEAVVRWRLRPTIAETWTQYFRYARGDATARMYPQRHALRMAVYAGLLFALSSRRRWVLAFAALAGAAYAAKPVKRALARFDEPVERAAAVVAVPALMAFVDAAKMAGYLSGLAKRARS